MAVSLRHKKQRLRAQLQRSLWIVILGERCVRHTTGKCKGKLTFDCIIPCGDRHHKMNAPDRMRFYLKQLQQNNVQLLCEYHQGLKSRKDVHYHFNNSKKQETQTENPF